MAKVNKKAAKEIANLINSKECDQLLVNSLLKKMVDAPDSIAQMWRRVEEHQYNVARAEIELADKYGIELICLEGSRSFASRYEDRKQQATA